MEILEVLVYSLDFILNELVIDWKIFSWGMILLGIFLKGYIGYCVEIRLYGFKDRNRKIENIIKI